MEYDYDMMKELINERDVNDQRTYKGERND